MQARDTNIQSFLSSGKNSVAGIKLRHKAKLTKMYAERGFTPLWSSNGQYTSTSYAVIEKLENSSLLGLHPSQYYTQILNSWLHLQEPKSSSRLDLVLTDVLFEYFDNLANGQTGERPGNDSSWFQKQAKTDIDYDAYRFFRGDASFRETQDRLQPYNENYTGLLTALAQHHKVLANGGYLQVSAGASLKPGMQDARVVQLRTRLAQSGDLADGFATSNTEYDWNLEEALRDYQQRHGLEADGILGSNTLAELNTPVEQRIAQIEVNLDRWRWLPRDLGESHIIVNTAGFEMDVILNGYNSLSMNVVVGKPKHKTPIFSDEMEHLVFNPSWHVPASITTKELLPKEMENPGYLDDNNFVAVSLTDKSARPIGSLPSYELEPSSFVSRYRLQQLPGKNNALGTVKFMLPNQYSIYLHDTNSKSLFEKTTRAYSHGCVRVHDPVQLAKTLLGNDGMDEYSVDEMFASDQSKTIRLRNKLPVHMTYQTSWVDDFGKLHFRPDIYDHDAHAIQKYQSRRPMLARRESQLLTQLGSYAVSEI